MRRDHRPYWMHRLWEQYEDAWTQHFLAPHFEALGSDPKIVRPWHVEVFGPNIAAGDKLHIIASAADPVRLTVWSPQDSQGRITLGDGVFMAGGTRLLAAGSIEIGDACLIARESVITDCDWHSLYDRVDPAPPFKPVKLGKNVWIGDGAFIGKGVQQWLIKMQPGGRRRYCTITPGIDGLVTLTVAEFVFPGNIRWQWHMAVLFKQRDHRRIA